jgi:abhydrolase domain-containing protein 1/3
MTRHLTFLNCNFNLSKVNQARCHLFLIFQRPFLAVKKGPFKNYLLKYVPTLEVKYWPTFWCFESRAQTVFASFLRSSVMRDIEYER